MTQSPKIPRRHSTALILGLLCGFTTLVVAFGVQVLLPNWSHVLQGAIVVGWMVCWFCLAPLVGRRMSQNLSHVAEHRRVP